jgi:hypothetical protein
VKTCSKCQETKPLAEFPRHRSDRTGYYSSCKPCKAKEAAAYRQRNIEALRRRSLEWHHNNRERATQNARQWRSVNAPVKAAYWQRWSAENREEWLRRKRENRDPALSAKHCADRRAQKLRATPPWANQFFIEEAYRLAQLRTKLTGFPWQVDHIVPLKHKGVCGLHVETNLRVVPEVVNARKGNRWDPAVASAIER